MGENLDEYDQAIFKQYMEDLDAEHAQALANGVSTSDLNGPMGGMGNQNQVDPSLGVRKADSNKIQSLIGGDDDEGDYSGMNPYAMRGMGMGMHHPMMGNMGGP